VPDLANRHAQKDLRIDRRGYQSGLFYMKLVIQRERPSCVWFTDNWIELNVIERNICGFSGRGRTYGCKCRIDLQNLAQIIGQGRRSLGQGNDTRGTDNDTDTRLTLVTKRYDLHDNLSE
jgi:hypothetical protein